MPPRLADVHASLQQCIRQRQRLALRFISAEGWMMDDHMDDHVAVSDSQHMLI